MLHTVFFRLLDALDYKLHHPVYSKICGKSLHNLHWTDYKPHLSVVLICWLASESC